MNNKKNEADITKTNKIFKFQKFTFQIKVLKIHIITQTQIHPLLQGTVA